MTTHDEDKIIAQQARIEQLCSLLFNAHGIFDDGEDIGNDRLVVPFGDADTLCDQIEVALEFQDDLSALRAHDEKLRAVFQAGAASRDAEIARLKTVPMKYRRMAFNAQLQDEVAELAKERDQLRAQINVLREAFQTFIDEHEECQDADEWMAELCSIEALHVAGEALATTLEQSLAEYRNKTIEECAKRAEAYAYMSQNFNALAEELRAMKEPE